MTTTPSKKQQDITNVPVKQNISDATFATAMLVLACIFVPFLIGACLIY